MFSRQAGACGWDYRHATSVVTPYRVFELFCLVYNRECMKASSPLPIKWITYELQFRVLKYKPTDFVTACLISIHATEYFQSPGICIVIIASQVKLWKQRNYRNSTQESCRHTKRRGQRLLTHIFGVPDCIRRWGYIFCAPSRANWWWLPFVTRLSAGCSVWN
jgi:hypothetical protein